MEPFQILCAQKLNKGPGLTSVCSNHFIKKKIVKIFIRKKNNDIHFSLFFKYFSCEQIIKIEWSSVN